MNGLDIITIASHTSSIEELHRANMERLTQLIIFCFGVVFLLLVLLIVITKHQQKKFKARMDILTAGKQELTAAEFLETARMRGGQDYTGVYILHNVTQDKYYIGQAKSVLQRVTAHLTGHGNGDVYADYKYGNVFRVKTITLAQSGYDSLNALERDLIANYDAYTKGYNRTRGNRN